MSHSFKKRNLEFLIHITLLAIILLKGLWVDIKISYYGLYLPLTGLFFVNVFVLVPRFLVKSNYINYIFYLLIALFVGFLLSFISLSMGQSLFENGRTSLPEVMVNYPSIQADALIPLIAVLAFSGIYSAIRQLIIRQRYRLLKRSGLFSILAIFIVALVTGIKYAVDVNWNGNKDIRFIDHQDFQSLEDIIHLPQFENKVIYVDLWFTSCAPCIREFGHLPTIKDQLKGEPVAYLYLAHKTSMPNDRQRWKNLIRKFDLSGWHIYMSPQLDDHIWSEIIKATGMSNARYPYHLLIGKNGVISSYQAAGPGNPEKLLKEIGALL